MDSVYSFLLRFALLAAIFLLALLIAYLANTQPAAPSSSAMEATGVALALASRRQEHPRQSTITLGSSRATPYYKGSRSLPLAFGRERKAMTDDATLTELNTRIAAIRENIRELIEQAAAYSGAADQERTADRIADQETQLAALLKKRDALLGK